MLDDGSTTRWWSTRRADGEALALDLTILGGAHKGEVVVRPQPTGLGVDELELLGMPGTLVVENGVPSVHRRAVTTSMHTTQWPLFDLVVRTPRLELRYPDDELRRSSSQSCRRNRSTTRLTMPFSVPWTDASRRRPAAQLAEALLVAARAPGSRTTGPARWPSWSTARCVGVQDVMAKRLRRDEAVKTGSWLTRKRQGEGIGKEMRAAILHLAFAGPRRADARSRRRGTTTLRRRA